MKTFQSPPGFTLLEILLVLFLIGILSMSAFSPFSAFEDEQKVITAASEFAEALRFARGEARRTGKITGVAVNPATDDFAVIDVSSATVLRHPVSRNPYSVQFQTDTLMKGVDIISIGGASGATVLSFYPDGRPNRGADTQILLSYANFSQTVVLAETTGRVTIY